MLLIICTCIFLIAAGVLSFLRLSLALQSSGLFIQNHPSGTVLAVFLIICALALVFICIKKYKPNQIDTSAGFSPTSLGSVCAILMMAGSFLKIVAYFMGVSSAKINIGDIVVLLLTFVALFYYTALLTLFNKGKAVKYISGVALIPVLWAVAVLIANYVNLTQMSTMPQYCYIIFAYLINILFFYYFAKVLSGYKCMVHCLIASSFAAVINTVAFLIPLIYDIAKYASTPSYMSGKALTLLVLDNLVFVFIIPFSLSVIAFLIKESKPIKSEK